MGRELIHERLAMVKGASLKHLAGDILHYSFATPQAFVLRTNKFAEIAAHQLEKKSLPLLIFKLAFSAPFKFVRNYFFRLGFMDGVTGLFICYYQSHEVFLKYYRAIELKLASDRCPNT